MLKFSKAAIGILIVNLCGAPAFAGSVTGRVTSITERADGLVYVYLDGTISGRAACAAGTAYWMVKDENSGAGKKQITLLQMAFAIGKPVTIQGAGECTRFGSYGPANDGEDIFGVTVSQ